MEYAKSILKLETILAITSEENHSSQKLLEKIGLKLEGKIPYEGTDETVLLYSN